MLVVLRKASRAHSCDVSLDQQCDAPLGVQRAVGPAVLLILRLVAARGARVQDKGHVNRII